MALPNIFSKEVSNTVTQRINNLTVNSQPKWGKMNVAQMLAHCNVIYEMVYEDKHSKPNFLLKFILKTFVKKIVVSETPYKHNEKTAPAFIISNARDFEVEKDMLINHIEKTQQLGESHFDNKLSHSFGVLSNYEWNNMFYKHLNHHLTQFGV
jgi:hypothetical protein